MHVCWPLSARLTDRRWDNDWRDVITFRHHPDRPWCFQSSFTWELHTANRQTKAHKTVETAKKRWPCLVRSPLSTHTDINTSLCYQYHTPEKLPCSYFSRIQQRGTKTSLYTLNKANRFALRHMVVMETHKCFCWWKNAHWLFTFLNRWSRVKRNTLTLQIYQRCPYFGPAPEPKV